MNLLEQQLTYPYDERLPAPGNPVEVAVGVQWLRMGLPFALDHINVWLLADETQGPAWTIVDCGVADDATRSNWETVFARNCPNAPVTRVIATHCHPDHVGLADWLCARWQAPLAMTAAEYAFARLMAASLPGADGSAAVAHFQLHGLTDPLMIAQLQGRKAYYPNLVPALPNAYQRLQDGQLLQIGGQHWRVITGFGHSPEHAALYCKQLGVLISGDMILPRISTNVSVFAIEPHANPLRAFLVSLSRFADLPEDTLVLPSHGRPFRGLHTRIAQLRAHHVARLADVIDACSSSPQSAADIVPMMFERALDAHQLSFALGEALAHLHLLWFEGKLQRQIGADGIVRFFA